MTYTNLVEAIAEAERFLKKAKELQERTVMEGKNPRDCWPPGPSFYAVYRHRDQLVAALAKLRRER